MDRRDRELLSREQRRTRRAINHQTAVLATHQSLEAAKSRLSEARLALASEDDPAKRAQLEKLVEEYTADFVAIHSYLMDPKATVQRLKMAKEIGALMQKKDNWINRMTTLELERYYDIGAVDPDLFKRLLKEGELIFRELKKLKSSNLDVSGLDELLAHLHFLLVFYEGYEPMKKTGEWLEKVHDQVLVLVEQTGEVNQLILKPLKKEGVSLFRNLQGLIAKAKASGADPSDAKEMVSTVAGLLVYLQRLEQ